MEAKESGITAPFQEPHRILTEINDASYYNKVYGTMLYNVGDGSSLNFLKTN